MSLFRRDVLVLYIQYKKIVVMKYFRILLALSLFFTLCSAFTLKDKKEKPVYAFGVAASFKDSVVYFTEIQLLDSVVLDKEGFLPQRDQYAYQLKDYVERDLRKVDYTCIIYFSENKNKLAKESAKVKGKYHKANSSLVEDISISSFSFKKPKTY